MYEWRVTKDWSKPRLILRFLLKSSAYEIHETELRNLLLIDSWSGPRRSAPSPYGSHSFHSFALRVSQIEHLRRSHSLNSFDGLTASLLPHSPLELGLTASLLHLLCRFHSFAPLPLVEQFHSFALRVSQLHSLNRNKPDEKREMNETQQSGRKKGKTWTCITGWNSSPYSMPGQAPFPFLSLLLLLIDLMRLPWATEPDGFHSFPLPDLTVKWRRKIHLFSFPYLLR